MSFGWGAAWRAVHHGLTVALALAALLLAGGCSRVDVRAGSPPSGCCSNPERQPRWMVALAEPVAPVFGGVISHIVWRDGYLADADAQRAILERLQPLDIVVVSSKGRLSGHTIPGLFQHAAVYVGSEAELRRLGMWNHRSIVPQHGQIRLGARFIEADQKGVHLSPPPVVLNTDRVAILRPRIATAGWQQRATATLFDHLGTRFDFRFDASRPDRLFCTELICHAIPELRLPRDIAYDRPTIVPDRVVLEGAAGNPRIRLVAYVIGSPSGYQVGTRSALRSDLDEAWTARR